jgi:Antitoxin VbhA
MYREIEIDRIQLTIMGVKFPNLAELERTANAIGSNMFEGFVPTQKSVEIIRDYIVGKISVEELIQITKAEFHG